MNYDLIRCKQQQFELNAVNSSCIIRTIGKEVFNHD